MNRFFRWLKKLVGKKASYPYIVMLDSTSSMFSPESAVVFDAAIVSDTREAVNPIDVMHELERPVVLPVEDLKEIEKKLEERVAAFKDSGASIDSETSRALSICRARMKYSKVATYFRWKTTVDSKIKGLTSKYKLEHRGISDFIKKIPTEAIKLMGEYTNYYKKVAEGSPTFSIIAPPSYFVSRDPILLAKSPFGQYYYILCAWDKEVEYVSDLLSEEKLNFG